MSLEFLVGVMLVDFGITSFLSLERINNMLIFKKNIQRMINSIRESYPILNHYSLDLSTDLQEARQKFYERQCGG